MSTSPHLTDSDYSPLEALALRALKRFGESAPSTVDAETMLMFIDFANEMVADIRNHPYYDNTIELRDYTHVQDNRPVADIIVVAGLLYRYAEQQDSRKQEKYEGRYWHLLNQGMYYLMTNGSINLELQAVDYEG